MSEVVTNPINEREERLKKLALIKALPLDPYPATGRRDLSLGEVLSNFDKYLASGEELYLAGRLRVIRSHGNLTFAHLQDGKDLMQIALSKKDIGDDLYKRFIKLVDTGDFLAIKAKCFNTHKGEPSLMVSDWQLITKTLRPLPEKWHGLTDDEERLRKRYLDIMFNAEVYEMIEKRSRFWNAVRSFLLNRGFLEVETPVLETTTGGADAKPFVTYHNALDMGVYLRISMGELWQKKLMVAGFPKTFEIGRQFRNEGMDAEHLQDYTQMEFYLAYANYEVGMKLVEEMYKYVAQETFGTLQFKIKDFDINLDQPWERYDYRETVLKYTKVDILKADEKEIRQKLDELGVKYDEKGFNITRAIDNLWKYCRKQIAGPGFLVGVPVTISPLAKRDTTNPDLAQRFQPIIAGSELGNGYSELNDPLDQEQRFLSQQKLREDGDEEAQMHDHDFVEALEYGMPPTCGFGMSERVFSFLMNKSARECQIFPLLKPKNEK